MVENLGENHSQDAVEQHKLGHILLKKLRRNNSVGKTFFQLRVFFACSLSLCQCHNVVDFGFPFWCRIIRNDPYLYNTYSVLFNTSKCRFCSFSSTMSPDLIFLPKGPEQTFPPCPDGAYEKPASFFLLWFSRYRTYMKYYVPLYYIVECPIVFTAVPTRAYWL